MFRRSNETSAPPVLGTAAGTAPGQSLRTQVPAHAEMTELLRHVVPGRRPWTSRLLGAPPLTVEAAAWYVGALGEQQIGRVLAGLPSPWVVLHAVPVGKGDTDMDHIVLGSGLPWSWCWVPQPRKIRCAQAGDPAVRARSRTWGERPHMPRCGWRCRAPYR